MEKFFSALRCYNLEKNYVTIYINLKNGNIGNMNKPYGILLYSSHFDW